MLSIGECTKHLKGNDEQQIEAVKTEAHQLAVLLVKAYRMQKIKPSQATEASSYNASPSYNHQAENLSISTENLTGMASFNRKQEI